MTASESVRKEISTPKTVSASRLVPKKELSPSPTRIQEIRYARGKRRATARRRERGKRNSLARTHEKVRKKTESAIRLVNRTILPIMRGTHGTGMRKKGRVATPAMKKSLDHSLNRATRELFCACSSMRKLSAILIIHTVYTVDRAFLSLTHGICE